MVERMSLAMMAIAVPAFSQPIVGQSSPDTTQVYCAAAKAAAGNGHINLYNGFAEVCGDRPSARPQPGRGGPPPQAVWRHAPAKGFDNSLLRRYQRAFVVAVSYRDVLGKLGVEGIVSNDTAYDNTLKKLEALETRGSKSSIRT